MIVSCRLCIFFTVLDLAGLSRVEIRQWQRALILIQNVLLSNIQIDSSNVLDTTSLETALNRVILTQEISDKRVSTFASARCNWVLFLLGFLSHTI